MKAIHPYLVFDGRCQEAFQFYQSALGGEISFSGTFKEMPPEFNIPESFQDRIMHMTLTLNDGFLLMGSDSITDDSQIGNNFSISIAADSKEEADRIFQKLTTEGLVTMPLQDTFWGSYFGSCTDKFGVQWMVSCGLSSDS